MSLYSPKWFQGLAKSIITVIAYCLGIIISFSVLVLLLRTCAEIGR